MIKYRWARGNPKALHFIAALFFLMASTGVRADDISVSASVDRTVAAINQPIVLTVSISGPQTNFSGMPALPPLKDFTVTSGTNTSTSIQIVNGRMTTTQSFSYTLIPNKVGKLMIGAISLKIKGKEYKTEPIMIEVAQNPPSPQGQPGEQQDNLDVSEELFIIPVVSAKTAYPNEGIKIDYKLYTRVDVVEYGLSKAPGTTGFWVEEYPVNQQPRVTQEVYRGRQFQVATIKEMVVFPQRSGQLTIDPLVVDANIRVRPRSNRDVFDSFFDDAFFGRTIRKTISSGPVSLQVNPLPSENKPVSFSNAVGNFKLSASVDKKNVPANEAISLKVTISGTGNIKLIEEPELVIEGDMERYAPKVNTAMTHGQNGVSGTKTFEYVLIPRVQGTKVIKPITFSYFDPTKKDYVSLSSHEIIISVTEGKRMAGPIPSNLSREEVRLLGQDVRFIKEGTPLWVSGEVRIFRGFPETFLLIFPFIATGAAFAYRRKQEKFERDTGYARSVRAFQRAQKNLKSCAESLGNGSSDVFISRLENALHGYIADKLNKDAAGLISDEVVEEFARRKVGEETVNSLRTCMEAIDYSRFAHSSIKEEDLRRMLEESRAVIGDIEKQLKANER